MITPLYSTLLIEINHLQKHYGALCVLDIEQLQITAPGIYTLLGPNGSGKSTLIKCLLGLVIPSSGEIRINSTPITGQWDYRRGITYVPQQLHLPPMLSVDNYASMLCDLRGLDPLVWQGHVEHYGLGPFLNKKLYELSGGTKQKVSLCLAQSFDTQIMIFDEPFTGLDKQSAGDLVRYLNSHEDKIILLSSHMREVVKRLNTPTAIEIQNGRLC